MPETKTSVVVKQEVEQMTDLVDQYLHQMWEEIWPNLVDLKSPAERRDWYQQIDWNALKMTSAHAWALHAADAQRLLMREEQRIEGATEAYHDETVRERAAFRLEQEPLGGLKAITGGGFDVPLPLGGRRG